jgi:hypothetical protein
MLRGAARVLAVTAVALCLGCGGLAHPLSDDGPDNGNSSGSNPGTTVVYATVGKAILYPGDTTSITGTFNGQAFQNNGTLITASSDTNVIHVGGPAVFAKGVGNATITVSYAGYTASPDITIAVVAR